ncbi:MAG: DegT/DnrJ/EryC1/StrS family aminotransferase [Spirochaetes bacterium]|nr:DegT/DnrJ/EryC1/StrS family aminotransferase [Spirochaetota bacterium]
MNSDLVHLKKPSLKRDDFLSVLDALIEKKIYPGELYNKIVSYINEKFGLKYFSLLPSRWVAIKLFLQYENIKRNYKKIFISNNSNPFYYQIFKEEGIEIIPLDLNEYSLIPNIETLLNENKDKSLLILSYPYGYPVDFSPFESLGINILADLSGSFGVKYKNKLLGKNFDYVLYSFNDEDIITCGDGCLFLINEEKKFIEYFKLINEFNLKLSDYNCALLLSQMEKIDKIIKSRMKLFEFYKSKIKNSEKIEVQFDNLYDEENYPNYNQFIIHYKTGYENINFLAKNFNIEIEPLIKKPISFVLNNSKNCPNSLKFSSEYFKIPFYPLIDEKALERVSLFLNKISE